MIRTTHALSATSRARPGSATPWIILGIGIVAAAGAAAFFVLKADRKEEVIAPATRPGAPASGATKTDTPKVDPPKSNPTKAEPPKVDPPKVTPKPDDKLVMPVAVSMPIAYKGIAVQAEYSPKLLAVCSTPKTFSNEYNFEFYDPTSCKRTGGFPMPGKSPPYKLAISPDGSRFAMLMGTDKEPQISVWPVAIGKAFKEEWSPYQSKPGDPVYIRNHHIVWIAFSTDDRLLTVTEGGRVAAWLVTESKPLFDEQIVDTETSNVLRGDRFNGSPKNIAFSPNRLTLAIQKGEGIILIDAASGKSTGKLPAPKSSIPSKYIDGMAFSPDGKRLAACYAYAAAPDSKTPKLEDKRIVIWDIAAEHIDADAPLIPHFYMGSEWSWWGDNHLIWHFGGTHLLVLHGDNGEIIRQCLPPFECATSSSVLLRSSDGKLRYVTNYTTTDYLVYDVPKEHLISDKVLDDGKGNYKRLELTKEGIEKKPADSISSSRKFAIPQR